MGRIFGLGETVLDVIFKENQPVAGKPGGSAFNALVSLGRAGHEAFLISEIGEDRVGENIVSFLKENHVKTDWLHRFKAGKTPVALAFLDNENNATYQVYKDFPEVRFQVSGPDFKPGDILLFGSFFAVSPGLRPQVVRLLKKAREQGAFLIYDPNFRKNHSHGLKIYRPLIEENFSLAHLVRGSDEDFKTIYGDLSIEAMFNKVRQFDSEVIITANSGGVHCLVGGEKFFQPAQNITPVSTIGAGDNFNAGMAHGISKLNNATPTPSQWKDIVRNAISFSTDVCLSFDNYISHEFAVSL
ncbi:PfkB family carbohydrate kinase [Marinilabilia rubra]|uniref:Fructokinase n=1 Tax=Marinilabilia rubra TaxID=2162893 RepID=A0A2U2B4Z1_9BACT|nr:PfkB family carbohydrate kinase [Marinilabilia rubra]PWD98104.1 fructokinase [Marinilabilia rubra]